MTAGGFFVWDLNKEDDSSFSDPQKVVIKAMRPTGCCCPTAARSR
ncbi:MAG: hypothetical protein QOC69_5579 [Mycobacterium sp.]|jgi:hypothetical protein|nr:hypothetical protein [Mycobacterium sp.]